MALVSSPFTSSGRLAYLTRECFGSLQVLVDRPYSDLAERSALPSFSFYDQVVRFIPDRHHYRSGTIGRTLLTSLLLKDVYRPCHYSHLSIVTSSSSVFSIHTTQHCRLVAATSYQRNHNLLRAPLRPLRSSIETDPVFHRSRRVLSGKHLSLIFCFILSILGSRCTRSPEARVVLFFYFFLLPFRVYRAPDLISIPL